jgi:hypothetical protein
MRFTVKSIYSVVNVYIYALESKHLNLMVENLGVYTLGDCVSYTVTV